MRRPVTPVYRLVRALLRLGLEACFREIRVHGRENFPPGGCRVVVANLPNSMIDPFLLAMRARVLARVQRLVELRRSGSV